MIKRLKHCHIWLIFGILGSPSCAHKTITFTSEKEKATVKAVPFDKVGTEGKLLGETPLTVSLEEIQDRVLRMERPGRASLYWVIVNATGDSNEISLDFNQVQRESGECRETSEPGLSKVQANRVLRLLLRAYQALADKQSQIALGLADQAIALEPALAGPHILKGLAQLQEGDKGAAKASFTKARTLDSEDRDLDTLLKASE